MSSINENFRFVGFGLLLLLMAGCAKNIVFSDNLIDEYQFSDDEIKNIQFYISDEITLQREYLEKSEKDITHKHSLTSEVKKVIETIPFAIHTPCIVEKIENDGLLLKFDEAENSFLRFTNKVEKYAFVETNADYQNEEYKVTKKQLFTSWHFLPIIGYGFHDKNAINLFGTSISKGAEYGIKLRFGISWITFKDDSLKTSKDIWEGNDYFDCLDLFCEGKLYKQLFVRGGFGGHFGHSGQRGEPLMNLKAAIGYEFLIGSHFLFKPSYECDWIIDNSKVKSSDRITLNFGLRIPILEGERRSNEPYLYVKESDLNKLKRVVTPAKGIRF